MRNLFARRVSVLSLCAVIMSGAPSCNTASVQVAYAHVRADGTLDTSKSKNVLAIGGGNGLYCFKLAFTPTNVVATLANDPTAANQGVGFIKAELPPTPLFTCSTIQKPDAVVETGTEMTVNGGTSAGGYAFYVHWTK
jgi:hypothetical protein